MSSEGENMSNSGTRGEDDIHTVYSPLGSGENVPKPTPKPKEAATISGPGTLHHPSPGVAKGTTALPAGGDEPTYVGRQEASGVDLHAQTVSNERPMVAHSAVGTTPSQPSAPPTRGGGELQPGDVIGKCKIIRELGRGGMGAVYLGHHLTLDVPVAIKILPPSVAARNPQFAERFMREGRLAARIKHPNVIGVLDADRDPATGLYYLIMEYVDGGSVKDLMKYGPIPERRALEIVAKVAEALVVAAEHNIVHRDIKPDNIMLTSKGEVKLADLGLAKDRSSDVGATMSDVIMGTPAYMSPEQAESTKETDARGDIYSLGATLYHMLVGSPPFKGETTYGILTKIATEPTPDPRTTIPDISDATAAICLKMMAKDKRDRYQSAAELLRDLNRVLREKEVDTGTLIAAPFATYAPGGASTTVKPKTQTVAKPTLATTLEVETGSKLWIGVAVAAVVILVGGAAAFFLLSPTTSPVQPREKLSSSQVRPSRIETTQTLPSSESERPPLTEKATQTAERREPPPSSPASFGQPARTEDRPHLDTEVTRRDLGPVAEKFPSTPSLPESVARIERDRTTVLDAGSRREERSATSVASVPTPPSPPMIPEATTRPAPAEEKTALPPKPAPSAPLPPPPPAAPAKPIDTALVEQAIAQATHMDKKDLLSVGGYVKKNTEIQWPDDEVPVVGFADTAQAGSENRAEENARKTALRKVVEKLVAQEELTAKKDIIEDVVYKSYLKYTRPIEIYQSGRSDNSEIAWVAASYAVPPGKLVKDLLLNGVKLQDIYNVIGRPTIGIDIEEVYTLPGGGKETLESRIAQEIIEAKFAELGIKLVDVRNFNKEEQMQKCDVLITGSNSATFVAAMPMPGGSVPFYRYEARLNPNITLTSPNTKLDLKGMEFAPKGKESIAYLKPSAPSAAEAVLKACAEAHADKVVERVLQEWTKLAGESDYLVGIAGAPDVAAVTERIANVPGVKNVVQRYINRGELGLHVEFDGSATRLQKMLHAIPDLPLKVTFQRGLRLTFEVVK